MISPSILVTGGSGSFGHAFVRVVLDRFPEVERLVIYSRDEFKQSEMADEFNHDPRLRFFIGDVRDYERLRLGMRGIDLVIHAAALKQIPAAEYNPMEVVKTNVLGAQNVVMAALEAGVRQVVALSTDKAVAPVNLYGATKLVAEKVFTASNNLAGKLQTRFCCVRYGNVIGSRGSVIPFFASLLQKGGLVLPVTHPDMTRFWMRIEQAVDLTIHAANHARGGEIFVPKLPSARIMDIVTAMGDRTDHKIVGIRPGEKIHETLIPQDVAHRTWDCGDCYMIVPDIFASGLEMPGDSSFSPVPADFSYNSDTNPNFLTISQIRELIECLKCHENSM